MHGNVLEWCSDWYDLLGSRPNVAVTDPAGPPDGAWRVIRGGCWFDGSRHCRSAKRYRQAPSARERMVGFRLAQSLSGTSPQKEGNNEAAEARLEESPTKMVTVAAEEVRASQLEGLRNSIDVEMKLIPAGTFTMGHPGGSAIERPHKVTLTKPFYIGVHEVTNAQWKLLMGSVPSKWKDDDRPVERVSWDEATEFCRTLSELPDAKSAGRVYRLPTEAEWEYACRAGTSTKYSFGDEDSRLGDFGWIVGNSSNTTHTVMQKSPNAWGLCDMHGNVREWCSDWFDNYPDGEVTDPIGPSSRVFRVCRGGGWGDLANFYRSATRSFSSPTTQDSGLGFRLACSQSPIAALPEESDEAQPQAEAASADRSLRKDVNALGIELLEIPAGTFQMGEDSGAVTVTLSRPLWLGTTEVTQRQWVRLMGTEPWLEKGEKSSPGDAAFPAVSISWLDAMEFCEKLTKRERVLRRLTANEKYRLPTSAEWEYACRAGTTTKYSFGDDESKLTDFAWFEDNSDKTFHAVGSKDPNPWGFHDMHGNVWEWCSDWHADKATGGVDPVGPATGSQRLVRGGGWSAAARYCTSSYYSKDQPPNTNRFLGFRVARGQSVSSSTGDEEAALPASSWHLADLFPIDSSVGYYRLEKGTLTEWSVNDLEISKGFLACAPSFIDFKMPTLKPTTLRGAVGISRVNANSKCRFMVFGDGRKLWESGVITKKPGVVASIVEEFSVNLTRVRTLRLAVDSLGDINSDHSVWIDPVIETKVAR